MKYRPTHRHLFTRLKGGVTHVLDCDSQGEIIACCGSSPIDYGGKHWDTRTITLRPIRLVTFEEYVRIVNSGGICRSCLNLRSYNLSGVMPAHYFKKKVRQQHETC